jgi:hypothetical protein
MKYIIVPLLVLSLTGCGFSFGVKKPPVVEVKKVEIERTKLNLEDPSPTKLKPLTWMVVTRENVESVFSKLEEQKKDVVLFGLSDNDYESLSINMFTIRSHIEKQKDVTKKYREYYEPVTPNK